MEISKLPRSGFGDSAIGPLLSESANKIMGKTSVKLVQPLLNRNLTIFSENSKYDLVDLLKIWCNSHQEDGLQRIQIHSENNFQTVKTKIYRNICNSNKEKWEKLNLNERYKSGFPDIRRHFTAR